MALMFFSESWRFLIPPGSGENKAFWVLCQVQQLLLRLFLLFGYLWLLSYIQVSTLVDASKTVGALAERKGNRIGG